MRLAFHALRCFRIEHLIFLLVCSSLSPSLSRAQDSSAEAGFRLSRSEISVTVRDSSGEIIDAAGNVKLYRDGMFADQSALSHGRAFFIFSLLGNYTVAVDATGYKPAEREINVLTAVKYELDVKLQRETAGNEVANIPGKPVLAPKAKEAFDKALKALDANKLDEAQKHLSEALQLAPTHPDLLYLQGVIYLRQKLWEKARQVLEQATQMDPKNARALSALGMAFMDEGKFDLAAPPLQQSVQLDPASWETHWTLARTLYHQQDFNGALKESQEALSTSHGAEPGIELLLAQSQVATGKFEDSATTLRAFLKNHPNDKGAPTARHWLDRLAADGKISLQ